MRRRLGIPLDVPVVVCTARMVRRKGQDTLVKAWPQVLAALPDARLLLVGDGPLRVSVERLAARLEMSGSVIFTGGVSWDDVPAFTDAGDVFAMPCRTRLFGLEPEAWGIVFLEAQACGLPVIVGDSGGAPETVADGAGVVVRTADVPSVATAIAALVADPSTSGRMGRTGRSAMMAEHTWARAADTLRETLDHDRG